MWPRVAYMSDSPATHGVSTVYFCVNEHGLSKQRERYVDHALVSVHTACTRTRLKPVVIYDGQITDDVRRLEDAGAQIIRHELSFKSELHRVCAETGTNIGVAGGTYLRIDIPLIESKSDFALYCDLDVMFRSDPSLERIEPAILAASSEVGFDHWGHFNSGVMVLNMRGFREIRESFITDTLERKLRNRFKDPYDQGNLNEFLRGRWDRLSQLLNWKPYWGFNSEAAILHWHGVKYPAAVANVAGSNEPRIHPELYAKSPEGYRAYMTEYRELLARIGRL
jgi:lipopolysaccharide biosynthesis glycosyltransferase